MRFEWDHNKASTNMTKHRVSFEIAKFVWDDPLYVLIPDRNDPLTGEQRWHAIGEVGGQVLLVVVHTYPELDNDDRVRIISARKATKQERQRYEKSEE